MMEKEIAELVRKIEQRSYQSMPGPLVNDLDWIQLKEYLGLVPEGTVARITAKRDIES